MFVFVRNLGKTSYLLWKFGVFDVWSMSIIAIKLFGHVASLIEIKGVLNQQVHFSLYLSYYYDQARKISKQSNNFSNRNCFNGFRPTKDTRFRICIGSFVISRFLATNGWFLQKKADFPKIHKNWSINFKLDYLDSQCMTFIEKN